MFKRSTSILKKLCGSGDSRACRYLGALEIFADRPGGGEGGGGAPGQRRGEKPPPGPVLPYQVRASAPAQPAQHTQPVRQPPELRVPVHQPRALAKSKAGQGEKLLPVPPRRFRLARLSPLPSPRDVAVVVVCSAARTSKAARENLTTIQTLDGHVSQTVSVIRFMRKITLILNSIF